MLWEGIEDELHEEIRAERLAKYQHEAGLIGDIRDAMFPFRVGDRVSVEIRGEQLGNGTIKEISTTFERGQGTKLYPAFRVVLDDGRWSWLNGVSLSRTLQKDSSGLGYQETYSDVMTYQGVKRDILVKIMPDIDDSFGDYKYDAIVEFATDLDGDAPLKEFVIDDFKVLAPNKAQAAKVTGYMIDKGYISSTVRL